jgi:hypothetical protein
VFGAGVTPNVFVAGANGFVARIITTIDADIAGDEVAGTPGTYAAAASLSGSALWLMQAVGFRVA